MDSTGVRTAVEDRYFEDYVPGAVHEFGLITVDAVQTGRSVERTEDMPARCPLNQRPRRMSWRPQA